MVTACCETKLQHLAVGYCEANSQESIVEYLGSGKYYVSDVVGEEKCVKDCIDDDVDLVSKSPLFMCTGLRPSFTFLLKKNVYSLWKGMRRDNYRKLGRFIR